MALRHRNGATAEPAVYSNQIDLVDGTTRRLIWDEFICNFAIHGCTCGRCKTVTTIYVFKQKVDTHALSPNVEDQKIVLIRHLLIVQPGMRSPVNSTRALTSTAQWVMEVLKTLRPDRCDVWFDDSKINRRTLEVLQKPDVQIVTFKSLVDLRGFKLKFLDSIEYKSLFCNAASPYLPVYYLSYLIGDESLTKAKKQRPCITIQVNAKPFQLTGDFAIKSCEMTLQNLTINNQQRWRKHSGYNGLSFTMNPFPGHKVFSVARCFLQQFVTIQNASYDLRLIISNFNQYAVR
ncbi:hypothetical protein CLF_107586 [Clonorchis sinensis]|uniref:Uncharacterized protein n=1 Tax=Clonorchis sinensis TaxID=79923 RepID=G7YGW8_CLOSI|nr:hypothetical protein CLF_107586 [Clonorchis sinensis]